MKLRFLLLALAIIFVASGARAQGGLYFNPIVTIVHNSTADTGTYAFLGDNQTQQIFGGVMFGGYYEVYHMPKLDFGLDLRDEIEHGNNAGLNNLLFGPRVTYHPTNSKLKPYLQIAIGDGHTHAPHNPMAYSKLELGAMIGVDRPINRHIDWRVVEIGYTNLQTINSYQVNGSPTDPITGAPTGTVIPSANLFHFSTGLIFRIP
jgi:hypothetical protein